MRVSLLGGRFKPMPLSGASRVGIRAGAPQALQNRRCHVSRCSRWMGRQHFLNFTGLPSLFVFPQGHGSFRPTVIGPSLFQLALSLSHSGCGDHPSRASRFVAAGWPVRVGSFAPYSGIAEVFRVFVFVPLGAPFCVRAYSSARARESPEVSSHKTLKRGAYIISVDGLVFYEAKKIYISAWFNFTFPTEGAIIKL